MLQRTRTHRINNKPIVVLPQMTKEIHQARLSDLENDIYEEVERAWQADLEMAQENGGNPNTLLFSMMLQLQQACTDPLLLLGTADECSPLSRSYDMSQALAHRNTKRVPLLAGFLRSPEVKRHPPRSGLY